MLINRSCISQRGNDKLRGEKETNRKDTRNSKNPFESWDAAEPGMAAQIAATSSVGPPINVVPVSMADKAVVPVVIATEFPLTVTAGGKLSIIAINNNNANSN